MILLWHIIGWHAWKDPDVCEVDVFDNGFAAFYVVCGTAMLFVATTLYILVIRRARQQLAQITREIERFHGHHQALRDEITRSKSIGMIFGVFIICWFPFVILAPLHIFYSSHDLIIAHNISVSFGMLNSALNSAIYGLICKEFQQGFKKLKYQATCKCCQFKIHTHGLIEKSRSDTNSVSCREIIGAQSIPKVQRHAVMSLSNVDIQNTI